MARALPKGIEVDANRTRGERQGDTGEQVVEQWSNKKYLGT